MTKLFKCSECRRPTGKNCPFINNDPNLNDSNIIGASGSDDLNQDIVQALSSVCSRLTFIEDCITKTEQKLQKQSSSPNAKARNYRK